MQNIKNNKSEKHFLKNKEKSMFCIKAKLSEFNPKKVNFQIPG